MVAGLERFATDDERQRLAAEEAGLTAVVLEGDQHGTREPGPSGLGGPDAETWSIRLLDWRRPTEGPAPG
jgi:hypothetical protein